MIDRIESATGPDRELDAIIAAAWPERWGKANTGRLQSKRRNQLRKAWRCHLELEALKAANPHAKCANCRHCADVPHTAHRPKKHCELDSDFYGYLLVKPNHVCTRWKELTL